MNTRFLILILGTAGVVVPARASMSYFNSTANNSQYTNAVAAAGLSAIVIPQFGTGYGTLLASHAEYDDSTTTAAFQAFHSNNSTSTFSTTALSSSSILRENMSAGDYMKIVLPPNVFAFSITVTPSAGIGTFCFEANVSAFDTGCTGNQQATVTSGNVYFGVVSTAPLSTIWLGQASGNDTTDALNFQDATAPEGGSMLLLGSGLAAIGLLRRRIALAAGLSARC